MADPPRFFAAIPLQLHAPSALPRQVAHHALRVLRLGDGASVTLFNGAGGEFHGTLALAGANQASFTALEFDPREAELHYRVSIGQGLCAGDKMDWLIEKAVELGAAALRPLALQKCVARLEGERADKRLGHWQQLIAAASEQCGRNRLMDTEAPITLATFLADPSARGYRLLLDPQGTVSLAQFAARHEAGAVQLLIGPEAGLSALEVEHGHAAGLVSVHLGSRILRTESAAMVALATINAHWAQ